MISAAGVDYAGVFKEPFRFFIIRSLTASDIYEKDGVDAVGRFVRGLCSK